ncbi:hypothetical protein O6H91_01G174900 [Diphasiastrum complanatum]|uniref:Uncharacterized protein n=1 Tax=Diphasiastrum complanatum TaxID=34168 RepID=A0ACC2EYU9_DIPCM|nr:hypothetical protein O6H91_01G174900 [Diphasiastrum complanatum]
MDQQYLVRQEAEVAGSCSAFAVDFRKLALKQRVIPEGYHLATVDEVLNYRHVIQGNQELFVDEDGSSSRLLLRLKDGYWDPGRFEAKQKFVSKTGVPYKLYLKDMPKFRQEKKLVHKLKRRGEYKLVFRPSPSDPSECEIENELGEAGALVALLYACEEEDEKEIEELLKDTGPQLVITQSADIRGGTPLHYSARHRKLNALRSLLSLNNNMDVAIRDDDGDTVLSIAAEYGGAEIMKELLGREDIMKQLINLRCSKYGSDHTPLMYATLRGDSKVVELLLEVDSIGLDDEDSEGRRAIHYAALIDRHVVNNGMADKMLNHRKATMKRLADAPAIRGEGDRKLLHLAAIQGHYRLCKRLLKETPKLAFDEDTSGRTPLFWAVENGKVDDTLKLLLKHVAASDPEKYLNHTDCKGQTILHVAAKETDDPGMMKTLIEAGVKAQITNNAGKTALHVACKLGKLELVCLLLNDCKELELATMKDFTGITPLLEAAQAGEKDIVKHLLERRQLPENEHYLLLDERDSDGRTALHWAVVSPKAKDALKVAKELLANAQEDGYEDLLVWASAGPALGTAHMMTPHAKLKQLLRKTMQKYSSNSLVMKAWDIGQKEMAIDFINRGADPTRLFQEVNDNLKIFRKASDQPTCHDKLGRTKLAKGIAALLLNPTIGTPIAVGIFAEWGTGKSSMMLQIDIILLLTMFQRSLPFSSRKRDEFGIMKSSKFTDEGRKILKNVLKEIKKHCNEQENENLQDFERYIQVLPFNDMKPPIFQVSKHFLHDGEESKSGDSCTTHNFFLWEKLFTKEWSTYRPLLRGLAIADKRKLVESSSDTIKDIQVPSVLPVFYNAWLFESKIEASAGLALKIMEELEECLTTSQWLRTCCEYAWKKNPDTIFLNLMLPVILTVVLGGWIAWLAWKLLSLANNSTITSAFQYGLVPVTVFVMTWTVLRTVFNVIHPVTQQLLQSTAYSTSHQEKLGYQLQVIEDIRFFKDQISKKSTKLWIVLGWLWCMLVKNRDNIAGTSIPKLPPSDKLRIVVFIDDLDRCKAEHYVFQMVSAINVILSVCDINVVLGVDVKMLQQAITSQLREGSEGKLIGQSETSEFAEKFLQKIIQVPIYLSEPGTKEMMSFLNAQLGVSKDMSNEDSKNDDSISRTASENEVSQLERSRRTEGTISELAIEMDQPGTSTVDSRIGKGGGQLSRRATAASELGVNEDPLLVGEGSEELAIDDLVLIATYTESEKRALIHLLEQAIDDRKQPRQWKRFLNYHRLAWNILSQEEEVKSLHGWQVQLIVWVFVCWQWKDEMDLIIKKWRELVREYSSVFEQRRKQGRALIIDEITMELEEEEDPENIHIPNTKLKGLTSSSCDVKAKQTQRLRLKDGNNIGGGGTPSLSQIVIRLDLIVKPAELESSKERKSKRKRRMEKMLETLKGEYDVKMKSILAFQHFRFHCAVDYLGYDMVEGGLDGDNIALDIMERKISNPRYVDSSNTPTKLLMEYAQLRNQSNHLIY